MNLQIILKATLILLPTICLTLPATAAPTQPSAPPPLQPNQVVFQPASIPIDDPELVNPGRGFYAWRGFENVPAPEPAYDEYERFFWHDPKNPQDSLETAPGEYNFAAIDRAIASAASRGHKFSFRVRAMANKRSGERYLPDYLSQCGWTYKDTFIPDWNAACFLDNAEKLMRALGERYDGDPRIAWVDIGMYGEWGEWALSDQTYDSAPPEISIATGDSLKRIIDMQIGAFPNLRMVMMAKTEAEAVIHALSISDKIGWRVDCFGREGYFVFATHEEHIPAWEIMKDRWKTAPVIVEFCTDKVSLSSSTPLKQLQDFHISLIGNGNMTDWDKLSKKEQENLILLGKSAGYRYQVRSVAAPSVWIPGWTLQVSTDWENVGVAPHYEPSVVYFKLYNPRSARYVWEARSKANLQALLPTGETPITVQDKLALPPKMAGGEYQLRLVVTDPHGYRKPLKLAIAGRQNDGSYLLGTITVQSAVARR